MTNSPIRITEKSRQVGHTVRLNISKNTSGNLGFNSFTHSGVNSDGNFLVHTVAGVPDYYARTADNPYPYSGDNVHWEFQKEHYQFEVEYHRTFFAYFIGLNYARIGGKNFPGANAGIAFTGSDQSLAYRADLNFHYDRVYTNVDYLTRRNAVNLKEYDYQIRFFNAKETTGFFNYGASLTLNTFDENWPINFFFNFGAGNQTLFSIKNKDIEDDYVQFDNSFMYLSAGVFRKILGNKRLVLGYRLNNQFYNNKPTYYGDLILQLDLLN